MNFSGTMTDLRLAQEQLQEDLLTLLEELDDDIKVVICKLVCETFDKLSPKMTEFTYEQRAEMIDQIRPLFLKWNNGVAPSDYIESLWAKMSKENLQVALDNFTRIDEDSEEFNVGLPLSRTQREELTETLAYRQLEGMDLNQLERYFLETQVGCYESSHTDAELLTEVKEYYDEDEFQELMAELISG
jgi:hypothetical protein